jgi:hypothetical protein
MNIDRHDPVYESMVTSVADYLQGHGYDSIRADVPAYEKPARLTRQGEDSGYVPDLTARKDGGKYYFEIVTENKDENTELAGKWRLFSTLAEHRNGELILLVPRGKMKFTNKLLTDHGIKANVMKFNEIA